MWIKGIRVEDFRCFKVIAPVLFSRGINLFVGPNNSGKSTIIKAIKHIQLQNKIELNMPDIRHGKRGLKVILYVDGFEFKSGGFSGGGPIGHDRKFVNDNGINHAITYHLNRDDVNQSNLKLFINKYVENNFEFTQHKPFDNKEPNNIIYAYSSKRNVINYSQETKSEKADYVYDDIEHIIAKFVKISGDRTVSKGFDEYVQQLLGIELSHYPAPNGNNVGLKIDDDSKINIDSMGDGVPHIISFLIDIIRAKNKIFLIEEIETNLHPKSIKKLCELIVNNSQDNQFIITTHSNIVAKHLGSEEKTKIFRIDNTTENNVPTATVSEVVDENGKINLLENLGYELFDYNLWNGWIIFEESSAETIIVKYLIPWFTPKLSNRLGSISAKGIDKLEAKVEDFDRLFLFIHKQQIYKDKAWVIFDGGAYGTTIKEKFIKSKYCTSGKWCENNFICLSKDNFEKYYPDNFKEDVESALSKEGEQKKIAKEELLKKVIDWIENNQEEAKEKFKESTKEIIDVLTNIDKNING
ncbi:ATP-binding protein [candidate division TA06 bacterium]|nr:ATP-binding protein [candidate division TA06 bacterium]